MPYFRKPCIPKMQKIQGCLYFSGYARLRACIDKLAVSQILTEQTTHGYFNFECYLLYKLTPRH